MKAVGLLHAKKTMVYGITRQQQWLYLLHMGPTITPLFSYVVGSPSSYRRGIFLSAVSSSPILSSVGRIWCVINHPSSEVDVRRTDGLQITLTLSRAACSVDIVDYFISSPCNYVANNNKWSKNFDDRPHRRRIFSLGKFNVTLDGF